MNLCAVSGTIPRLPVVMNDGRTIRFLVTTRFPYPNDQSKIGTSAVPCSIVEPTSQIRAALLDPNVEGKECECRGYMQRLAIDGPDGLRRFSTEVVVDERSLLIRRSRR